MVLKLFSLPHTMSETQHSYSIDLIRLVSTIAIIIIHVSGFVVAAYPSPHHLGWPFALFLASYFRWGTPVFIMVSGYLLLGKDKYTPAEFYRRRLKRLLIPFLFWNLFYYFIYTGLNGVARTPIDFLNRFISGGTFYHLYFLYLILGLYFITPFLNKYVLPSPKLGKITISLVTLSFIYVSLYTWLGFPQLNNIFTC